MKKVGSYIFLSLLLSVYMITSMGFEVHTCFKEGNSKVIFLADETPCTCKHHKSDDMDSSAPDSCCSQPVEQEEPEDLCCYTSIYILNPEQNVVDYLKVGAPKVLLAFTAPTMYNNLNILNNNTFSAFHVANAAPGPDGGLASITPLRL